ncbi:cytochrome D1 domain-containing protein [Spirulina major CS-329]|uniref:cytochrome D1 domain-containing protein n=1 Tax=Spirulina TaxID=1154 RepID=UPI0023303A55|nr:MULTISPECIES: cytochrome D1 domain-containing protein [Spirulina]MDB9494101.1 cytochrome D1 domain-containing protein [Spirulina subsalsa CS-330]MDB9505170.1 cytochrome D1 domain-containing protein [Spirulina major CS-329]
MQKKPWLLWAESVAIAASISGTITAALTRQFLYAATPLTIAMGLNVLAHQRSHQRQRELENQLATLQTELIAQVQAEIHPVNQAELTSVRDRITALEQQSTTLPTQLASLQDRLEDQLATQTAQDQEDQRTLTHLTTTVNDLKTQLDAVSLDPLTATVEHLQHQMQQFGDSYDPADFGTMKTVVEALKAQLRTLTDSETHRWQNIERTLTTIQGQVDGITTVEPGTVESLQTAIATLQAQVQDLPSPPDWQPAIADLQTTLQDLQTQWAEFRQTPPPTLDPWDVATPPPAPPPAAAPTPTPPPVANFEDDFDDDEAFDDELNAEYEAFHAAETGESAEVKPVEPLGHELETGIRDLSENLWGFGRSLRDTLTRLTDSVDFPHTDPESLQSWACTATFPMHHTTQGAIAISPQGDAIATRHTDGHGVLVDVAQQAIAHTLPAAPFTTLAFSPDGQHLLIGHNDGSSTLWRTQDGTQQQTLSGHPLPITAIAFSPHGRTCATASGDKLILLWDTQTGQTLRPLKGHWDTVMSLVFSPDGEWLISGSRDGTVKRWDVATGDKVANATPGGTVQTVAISPDGQQVASGSSDRTLYLWAANTLSEIRHQRGLQAMKQVAYSPDGRLLATAAGKVITLWSVANSDRIAILNHPHPVTALQFTPTGQDLISVTAAGDVSRWQKP